jgi:hypothetical protein
LIITVRLPAPLASELFPSGGEGRLIQVFTGTHHLGEQCGETGRSTLARCGSWWTIGWPVPTRVPRQSLEHRHIGAPELVDGLLLIPDENKRSSRYPPRRESPPRRTSSFAESRYNNCFAVRCHPGTHRS